MNKSDVAISNSKSIFYKSSLTEVTEADDSKWFKWESQKYKNSCPPKNT